MKTMNMPDRFGTGSALVEFLAGRLGAPECWPDDGKVKATVIRGRGMKHGTPCEEATSRSLTNTRSHLIDARHLINQKQGRHE